MSVKLYVITSSKTFPELRTEIKSDPKSYDMSIICKKTQEGMRQTNKTILYTTEEKVVSDLMDAKNFVHEYAWSNLHDPNKSKGEENNLFFNGFPRGLPKEEVVRFITANSSYLTGVLKDVNFIIKLKPDDREIGTVEGYGKIVFPEAVTLQVRKIYKTRLHNMTYNHQGVKHTIRCTWEINPKYRKRRARRAQNINKHKLPEPLKVKEGPKIPNIFGLLGEC